MKEKIEALQDDIHVLRRTCNLLSIGQVVQAVAIFLWVLRRFWHL